MAGTHGFGARGVFDDGGPAGDANTERSSAFGSLRADMLAHVGQIRRLQLQMFKEHIELEVARPASRTQNRPRSLLPRAGRLLTTGVSIQSQPGPDVAFGVPDDSADAFAPGGHRPQPHSLHLRPMHAFSPAATIP